MVALGGGDGMPSFTGHPLVDVGLSTITAFADKTRPEDLTEKDYEAMRKYSEIPYKILKKTQKQN